MGCHTWFSVPYKTDKKEIIEMAQKSLDEWKECSDSDRQMYQYAIDMELVNPVCNLASGGNKNIGWKLYKDVQDWDLDNYNIDHGTNYDSRYHPDVYDKIDLESYSDEPRIGGYPDKVITSYQEMLDFMKTGFVDEEGIHHNFYYDEGRYPTFMKGIQEFFIKHPDGIITFG